MKRLVLTTVLLLITAIGAATAQELKITAQMRFRGEFEKNRAAFNNATFGNRLSANEFNLLRSRLGFLFTGTNDVSAFFQFQDSRRFGEETNTLSDGDADQLDLHQGYIKIDNFIFDDLSLKIGRMEIAIANERIVGPVGWDNIGRSFDGGMLEMSSDVFSYSLFATRVKEDKPFINFDPDEDFFGFFGTYKNITNGSFTGFALLNWNSDRLLAGPDVNKNKLVRLTVGFDAVKSGNRFDQEYEAAFQAGKRSAGHESARDDIRAYMIGVRLKYKFDYSRKPFLGAGFDLLSGDDNGTDDKYNTFDTMYATNHKFYGFMDYFLNIPSATSKRGLTDFIITGGLDVADRANVKGDFHYFRSAKENPIGNSYLGSELDITLRYNYRTDLGIQAGLSLFFPGDIPKQISNNDNIGIWYYYMLTYNFREN